MDAATLAADADWSPVLALATSIRKSAVDPPPPRGSAGALAIVAHDLKGPLCTLLLLVESIRVEAQSRSCGRIALRARRAEQLIDRLDGLLTAVLQRSRTHGDALAFAPSKVDLAGILETVVALNRPLAEHRSVRVHSYSVDPLHVQGDAHLLMQAVDNLLSNAVKHTRRGGLVVCEAAPAADGGAMVCITDQGPGLTDQDLARAFRPFTRLTARSDAPGASNGLGLWIVRLIAERHGGSVEAKTRGRGTGAVFTLRLPANQ